MTEQTKVFHKNRFDWGTAYSLEGMMLFAPGYETSFGTYENWHLRRFLKDEGGSFENIEDALKAASLYIGFMVELPK